MDEMTANGTPTLADAPDPARLPKRPTPRQRFEYIAALAVLKPLGWLPHRWARGVCGVLAALSYWLWPRLRRVGLFNLRLAFPEWSERDRRRALFGLFQNLGRMLADFTHFPRMHRGNIERFLVYEGFENYARAQKQGKGILFLTAHFGNWEISSFGHGLYGYPCNFIVRELDNPLIGALVQRYRSRSGGRPIEKTKFGSQVLRAFKNAEAVGILMDQNMLLGEGEFVDFFGRPACTTTAPARLARRTGVPIVLGLVIWDKKLKKYKLRFDPVEWIKKDNAEQEILVNTANFTRLIEQYVRRYPDHWLWVHRRWKTRPPGEPPLY
jgi:Kdo2-lipid IVA lauroyltransferase/acyltransferase